MPFPIKTGLSIIVLLVAIAAYFYQDSLGMHGPKIAILFLAPFMVPMFFLTITEKVFRSKRAKTALVPAEGAAT